MPSSCRERPTRASPTLHALVTDASRFDASVPSRWASVAIIEARLVVAGPVRHQRARRQEPRVRGSRSSTGHVSSPAPTSRPLRGDRRASLRPQDRAASARPCSSRSSSRSAISAAAMLCSTTCAASATQNAALARARWASARSRPSASSINQSRSSTASVNRVASIRVDALASRAPDQQIPVADAFGDLDRLAEERDRLLFRPCPRRDVGGHHEVLGGLRVVTRLAVVVRKDRRGFPDTVTRLALDERRDHTMALPARGPRQRPVGDLAREHMLEDELSIADHARGRSPSDEVSPLQIVQDVVEIGVDRPAAPRSGLARRCDRSRRRPGAPVDVDGGARRAARR